MVTMTGYNNKAFVEDKQIHNNAGSIEDNSSKHMPKDVMSQSRTRASICGTFRYATALDWLLMAGGFLASLIHGGCFPIAVVLVGSITDNLLDATGLTQQHTMKQNESLSSAEDADVDLFEETNKIVFNFVYVGIAAILATYVQETFWAMSAARQAQRVRRELFRSILRQDMAWHDKHSAGEFTSQLIKDIGTFEDGIGRKLAYFWQWASMFVAGALIAFLNGWKLSLVVFATSPLLIACGAFIAILTKMTAEGESKAYAESSDIVSEVFSSITTVYAFNGQAREVKRYKESLLESEKFGIKRYAYVGLCLSMLQLVQYVMYAVAFGYGAQLAREEPGSYTGGSVLIVLFNVFLSNMALGISLPNLQEFLNSRAAAKCLWETIDRMPTIDSLSQEGQSSQNIIGGIELKSVDFTYPTRPDVQVLKSLSLDVQAGKCIALVGHSGCGKSTVVGLLQRLYDVNTGSITIDNTNIKDLNVRKYRQQLGLVTQEPVLFPMSIQENIKLGSDGVSMDEMIDACKAANVYGFISSLPHKFDTLVVEDGSQLSGGQKQRIAIARALVRKPKILILDEATSALDPESELLVQDALEKASQGRTTIVIAHRLSTIKHADTIYVIKEGTLQEQGTHDDLIAKQGSYYDLVKTQESCSYNKERKRSLESTDLVPKYEMELEKQDTRTQDITTKKKKKGIPFMRILRLNSPEWLLMLFASISSIPGGIIRPAFAIILAESVGAFALEEDKQKTRVLFLCMMFILMGVLTFIFAYLKIYLFGVSGEKLTTRLRETCFRIFLQQDISFFEDPKNSRGSLNLILGSDASAVQGATGTRVGILVLNTTTVLTAIIIGFVFSWKLVLLVIVTMPIIAATASIQMKIMQRSSDDNRQCFEEANKVASSAIKNIATVVSLTREQYFIDMYTKLTKGPFRKTSRKTQVIGVIYAISQAFLFLSMGAIFYFGTYLVENDGLSVPSFLKVFISSFLGTIAISQATQLAPDYGKAVSAAANILSVLDLEKKEAPNSSVVPKEPLKGHIQLNSVSFSYPMRPSVPVLRDIDLNVTPGRTVALVGTSGCGKSTIVKLLQGFYDALDGVITLDQHNITSLDKSWMRAQMGFVQQEPILFNTSIEDNISYGCGDATTMDRIIQAAKAANIHNFISSLPQGYKTTVGPRGTQLSGGQKQRIALARALIRDPRFLLLDEATSALDTQNEQVVQEALEGAKKGRTCITIAHRLSTIRNSDHIIVIQDGRVQEQGTHSSLLEMKGKYHQLVFASKDV